MISEDAIKAINATIYTFDEFQLDAKYLLLSRNSEVVSLAPKACEVLLTLFKAEGKLITKQEILDKVWKDTFVEEANLTHHISALRKALGEDKNGRKFIETIPRRGFHFVAEIRNNTKSETAEVVINERDSIKIIEEKALETRDLSSGGEKVSTIKSAPILTLPAEKNRRLIWQKTAVLIILLVGAAFFFGWRKFYSADKPAEIREPVINRLTPDADVYSPAISPDGLSVAFLMLENKRFTFWRKSIVSGEISQLLPVLDSESGKF